MLAKQLFYACAGLLLLVVDDVTGVATGSGHTHTGVITGVQLDAGVAVEIIFSGSAHTHNLPLTGTEVQTVAQGQRVEKFYTDALHAHLYTFNPGVQVEGKTWGDVKQAYRK